MWDYYISITQDKDPKLINLSFNKFGSEESTMFKEYGSFDETVKFRTNELEIKISPLDPDVGDFYLIAYFDKTTETDLSAILSILRTIFVCVILAGAALLFSKDATDLVLNPIETMLRKINNITENPLKARNIEEEEAFLWEKIFKENKEAAKEKEEKENYETSILEKIIVKIGGLLAIGFGQAGSEIIVQNMQKNGGIDPMIPGKTIMAIFGFCDIRNFTDATEIL